MPTQKAREEARKAAEQLSAIASATSVPHVVPRFASGGVMTAGGSPPGTYTGAMVGGSAWSASASSEDEYERREREEREAPLVVLPSRAPRKVLVAFFDQEGDEEPSWAAYLEPRDLSVNVSPGDARDSYMSLTLDLRKKFEQ